MKQVDLRNKTSEGYALVMVMVFTGLGLLISASILGWSSSQANLIDRKNAYYNDIGAAEGATEKILAHLARDFQRYGYAGVANRESYYRYYVPTSQENNGWIDYEFNNPAGGQNQTYLNRITDWQYTNLNSAFSGHRGYAATYRLISNARDTSRNGRTVALKQDIQIANIPIFQFLLFYAYDLELHPGSDFQATGRIHGNGSIYSQPNRTLTFQYPVTASQKIIHSNKPGDPVNRQLGNIVYQSDREEGLKSLNIPLGTNNSPALLHSIIEIPPSSEPTDSLMGQQRYYNKMDLIILVSNDTVVAKSGAFNGFATSMPWPEIKKFLSTNASFFNKRENKTVIGTDLDVLKFHENWPPLSQALGRSINSIYVADMRSQSSSTQSGVRLVNCQNLPQYGLTVATPNPLYVKGHFNANSADLGTSNTTRTAPGSLIGDSITILSGAWRDEDSGSSLGVRDADNTTINAGIIAGIVPTGGGYYSGGGENFPRMLEDWSGMTLTINGSLVGLYYSRIATAPWGASSDVYNPPRRNWSFDRNFLDWSKLPEGTPELRTIIRGQWTTLQANSIN